jgi:GT2 family glycosyltransferase/peptidoglycan/xylan/chitin deacetylase (PgdA/CDA1 family)
VIVIDNASTDGSPNMVRTDFPKTIIIENSENRGYAAGVNRGIVVAKGRYVLVLNSDIIICRNAIGKTVRYADRHPEVAIIGCQVLEDPDNVQMTCFRFPSVANLFLSTFGLAKLFKYNTVLGREWMLWWKRDSERYVDVISGMFMLVRREAINQVGLLDERFFMYCEEADWCLRFKKRGWKILFWPGAKIFHVDAGSHSTCQVPVQMFVQQQKSLLIFLKKHTTLPQYWLGRLILVVSFSLKLCVRSMSLIVKRILSGRYKLDLDRVIKYWMALKFCAFGIEPGGRQTTTQLSHLFRHLKETVEFVFSATYSLALSFSKKPRCVAIYYHKIGEHDLPGFKKQMAYLAYNCCVVKPSQLKAVPPDGSNPVVAITFDDAYASVAKTALPILEEYKLPAGVFVPTENLGYRPRWAMSDDCPDADETIMTKEQIAELDRKGFEIFSHTVSHPVLTEIDDISLQHELADSRTTLEEMLGHKVLAISYPHGAYDSRVCGVAKGVGYQLGFTIEPQMVNNCTDDMQIGRFRVSPRDSLLKFKLKVCGAYQAICLLRNLKMLIRS